MKNPNTKRKFRAILIAAIVGALFADSVGWIGITHPVDATNHGMFVDTLFSLIYVAGFFLCIPVFFVMSVLGITTGPESYMPYLTFAVISLEGAIVFAFVAIIWQFFLKKNTHEIKS